MFSKALRQQLDRYVAHEDWAQVIDVAQSALLTAENAQLYAYLGRSFVRVGDDGAAIAAYTQALQHQPSQPKFHSVLGELYARQQKMAAAVTHYRSALLLVPAWPEVSVALGRLLHRLGDSVQAQAVYQGLLQQHPERADAHVALGLLYEQRGDDPRAIRSYRNAAFAKPNYALAYRHLGAALTRLGHYQAALTVYQQAIAACPKTAALYNSLGRTQQSLGHTEKAIAAYMKALRYDPALAAAHQNLGRLCYQYQSYARASQHFQQACQLAPDSVTILRDYAWTLAETGQWQLLLSCFRQAITLQSELIAAYCQRALQLPEDDLLFRAQRTCAQLLVRLQNTEQSTEDQPLLLEQLAQVYIHLGELSAACHALDRAKQCYQSALSIVPERWQYYQLLGDCLVSQGRSTAAITIYQAGLLQAQLSKGDSVAFPSVLQSKLQQALAPELEVSSVAIQGVYRYAQDWLADRGLAAPRAGAEASVPIEDILPPDPKCGSVTCVSCMEGLVRQFAPVQVSKSAFACSAQALADTAAERTATATEHNRFPFSTFALTLPNGRAWIAPKQNDWAVCEEIAIFSDDDFLLGNVSRCYPWYLPGCSRHDVTHHTILQRKTPLPAVRSLPGKVAILSGLSGHVYYHWLFDVLPRFNILQTELHAQGQTLADIDTFVENNINQPFQRETLSALNIPLDKVVASDRIPHIQAQQLVVPSFPGHLDWVPPSTIDFLRRVFLPARPRASGWSSGRSSGQRRRLYISRGKAKYRHELKDAEESGFFVLRVPAALSCFRHSICVRTTG